MFKNTNHTVLFQSNSTSNIGEYYKLIEVVVVVVVVVVVLVVVAVVVVVVVLVVLVVVAVISFDLVSTRSFSYFTF